MAAGQGTRGGRARALALLLAVAALAPWARRLLAAAPPDAGGEPLAGVERDGTVRLYPLAHAIDRLAEVPASCRAPGRPRVDWPLFTERTCPLRERGLPLATRRLLGLRTDPNAVSAADLMALEGIGPQLARRILARRQQGEGFQSVDDLDAIPGVGPARLATLRAALNPAAP